MTNATRLGNVITRLSFGAMTSMGLAALAIAGSHPSMAQGHGPAALAGTVSSAEEGKMEGVVVSAKRPGSTIMVSVSTNAQGQYIFRRTGSLPAPMTSPSAPSGTRSSRHRQLYNRVAPRNSTSRSRRPRRTFLPCKCPTANGFKAHPAPPGRKWHWSGASIVMACSVRSFPRRMRRKWRSRWSA